MDIQLDDTGDIAIEAGDLQLVSGAEAIRQHLHIKFSLFRGEWFLDRSAGMTYFDDIFEKPLRYPVAQAVFRDAVMSTPGVKDIADLDFEFDSALRALKVSFVAITNDDERLAFEREVAL